MAEGARLESVFTRKGNVGSNPTLSASKSKLQRSYPACCREIRKTCPYFAIFRRQKRTRENGLLGIEWRQSAGLSLERTCAVPFQ